MRRLLAVSVALAGLAAGCGGGNDEEASALLDRGFSTDVRSGVVSVTISADLEGIALVQGPIEAELGGPFDEYRLDALPRLDWELTARSSGRRLGGGLVTGTDNGWVEFQGESYEIGEDEWAELERLPEGAPRTYEEAGVEPLDWIRNAEVAGEEEVNGVRSTRVVADLDVGAFLASVHDFMPGGRAGPGLPSREQLEDLDALLEESRLEAWIGDDDIWRRVRVELELDVPEERHDDLGGLESGELTLEAELTEPNQPQRIVEPEDARPLAELLGKLGLGPLLSPS